jgi:hypothetical protein
VGVIGGGGGGEEEEIVSASHAVSFESLMLTILRMDGLFRCGDRIFYPSSSSGRCVWRNSDCSSWRTRQAGQAQRTTQRPRFCLLPKRHVFVRCFLNIVRIATRASTRHRSKQQCRELRERDYY